MNKPIYKFGCLCMIPDCNLKAQYMISIRDLNDNKKPMYYFCEDHTQKEHQKIKDNFCLYVIEVTNLRDIELGIAEGW